MSELFYAYQLCRAHLLHAVHYVATLKVFAIFRTKVKAG